MEEELNIKKKFLLDLYADLLHYSKQEKKVQIIALIIDLKRDDAALRNLKNSLYLDVKRFISVYLRNKRNKDFGYEDYDRDRIVAYISNSAFTAEEKYRLFIFTDYILKTLSYENAWLDSYIYNQKLQLAKDTNWIKWLLLSSSKNIFSILLSICIVFAVECIILLPAPCKCMECFEFGKSDFSSNQLLNHIFNVLSLHFSCVDNSAKLSFNGLGLIGLIASSFVYIVIVINFLFKNLLVNFKIDVAE